MVNIMEFNLDDNSLSNLDNKLKHSTNVVIKGLITDKPNNGLPEYYKYSFYFLSLIYFLSNVLLNTSGVYFKNRDNL